MNTRSILILAAILLFGVLVTMGLVSQSTSDTKTDSSKAAEGATGLGAKRIRPARATQSKPPTVKVEKRDLQPAAREKFDPSKIRQALSELQALEKGGGSIQQIQEKITALQAAIESGMKKDPKSALDLVLGHRNAASSFRPFESKLFVKSDPDFAIALLDQVPEKDFDFFVTNIGSAWAESDPKAALAWANQQTDPEIKEWILGGVIPSMAQTDLQGAFAYVQSLPPGYFQDNLIRSAFSLAAMGGDGTPADDKLQGALAMIQSLPEGRTKDLAAQGISKFMEFKDPQAALNIASGIGATSIRFESVKSVARSWFNDRAEDRAAATQWMQSLPEGETKDLAASGISQAIVGEFKTGRNDPQAAMDMASGIGDSNLRAEAQEKVVELWTRYDPAAATHWMQSLPEGPTKEAASNGILIGRCYNYKNPQAGMDMALGIGDSNLRTQALKNVARKWFWQAPTAATQWINRSALPQEVKTQLLLQR